MNFLVQNIQKNIKRILIVGTIYTTVEILGLILSTLGFFDSDIRVFVLMIVLFHLVILPYMYWQNRQNAMNSKVISGLIFIYISVIISWAITFTTLVYLDQKDLTVLTIVLLICASLFIVPPKVFRIILGLNFGYYLILINLIVDNKRAVNGLGFKGFLFFILAAIISQMHYSESLTSYNLRSTLQDKASRDSLSGLYNNAYIFRYLEDKINEYVSKEAMSVLMMDIDSFKNINDRFGHLFGDEVIKRISAEIVKSTHPTDLIGRYGGEEFIVILNNADIERTIFVAEAIRNNIENMVFEQSVQVTMSIGIAFYNGESANELIQKADDQLYRAKKLGKNRVVRDEEA